MTYIDFNSDNDSIMPGKEEFFFTGDSHFGHRFLALERGFIKSADGTLDEVSKEDVRKGIEAMDEALIKAWNEVVPKNGIVYHLGDFSFHRKGETLGLIDRLNGRIRLLRGNHDKIVKGEVLKKFEWVKNYYEAKGPGGVKIVMCHYAFLTWNKSHYLSWNLHGHSHGSLLPRDAKQLDVGVDTNDLKPYTELEVETYMSKKGLDVVDHHTKRRSKLRG